ncbi:MAG: tRNA lysidine(34) synthetase TilS, partial [Mariprofundaceae bacterium]|nr:tRNA lysidine(34) synthetase TilS [Mariprofundaceae bacterium]
MLNITDLSMDQALPHTLAVGWSGGLDSTALLLLLKQKGFNIQAWHIDHAWHEQSAQDCNLLKQRAKDWGIPFLSKRLPHYHQRNREAEARKGRYASFQSLAEKTGIKHLALGHHADDQVETVCMRMLQGAGVMGLRGMQSHMSVQALHIYRPLLHVRRHILEQCLKANHIPWLEDSSNSDVSLWRNKIRCHLLPAMQAEGIDSFALWMRWQQQAVRVSREIESGLEHVVIHQEEHGCWVNLSVWQKLPHPIRVQVIQRMAAITLGVGKVL